MGPLRGLAIGLLSIAAFGCGTAAGHRQDSSPSPSQADIRSPGPDFGSISNSAQVVGPGRVYLETMVQSIQDGSPSLRTLFLPTLLRVGVSERLELRGGLSVLQFEEREGDDALGWGPLSLGVKYNLTKGGPDFLSPAVGIEALMVLPSAYAGMGSGKVEPAATLNFDHRVVGSTVLNWNVGAFGAVDADGAHYFQGFVAAALGQFVTDDLMLFVNGDVRGPAGGQDFGASVRAGPGFYWFLSRRIAMSGAYNWGLTDEAIDSDALLSMTFAF